MKILITGANGYIGLRLMGDLHNEGHDIVAVVRNRDRIDQETQNLLGDKLTIIEHDFLNGADTPSSCPADIDVAYYLIHSMGSGAGFHDRESSCAQNFTQWISSSACKQIVYLSGIIPPDVTLSTHLSSRQKVEDILAQSSIPITTLRASIIVGSGSASFEIIRDLVEKLPIMITPKWANTLCQPIAIRNVIEYLTQVIHEPQCLGQSFDIGGTDQISYLEMLLGYADARKLKRFVIPAPFFSPRLSSYWLSLMTATNYQLARALVGSLHMETICNENRIREIISIPLLSYAEAIDNAFSRISQNRVPSTWYGALSSGTLSTDQIRNIQVPEFGILTDRQAIQLVATPDEVLDAIWSIGGKRGWPTMNWAWKLRGFLDTGVGGIGMRRGRRSPTDLKPGDALDFWRVILADRESGRLMLYAEMKLPGEAWLEFHIKDNILHQTATFRPKGIFGRLYWYSTLPFHLVLFPRMISILSHGWAPNKKTHS